MEALLVAAGVLTRAGSVVDGSTVCDFDDAEIDQQRSVGLALAPLQHNGIKVNLIDTPGYADFVGELRAGLRAADCALFVIAANESIDEPTRSLWQECAAVGMPRAVAVTKLDHASANYDERAGRRQAGVRRQGAAVLPCQSAHCRRDRPAHRTYYGFSGGTRTAAARRRLRRRDRRAARHPDRGIIEESEDETLMERYLGGEEIDQAVLIDDLEKAVARGSFFPVHPGVQRHRGRHAWNCWRSPPAGSSSPPNTRLPEVFTPAGGTCKPMACDSGRAAAGRGREDDVGSLRRAGSAWSGVFSGTIRPDATVHVSGHFSRRSSVRFLASAATRLTPVRSPPRRPRRGRAHRHAVVPARQAAAAGAVGGGR